MIFKIIKQRFKIKKLRNENLTSSLIVLFFVIIATAGILLYQNAQEHALTTYWNKTGDADVIALFQEPDSTFLSDDSSSIVYAYVDSEGKKVESENAETYSLIAYANLSDVNQKFALSNENVSSDNSYSNERFNNEGIEDNSILINSELMEALKCNEGDEISVGGNLYKVVGISGNINFISSGQALAVINKNDFSGEKSKNNWVIAFANYDHDFEKIKYVVNLLDEKNISYINQYEGIESIEEEFINLKSIMYILFAFVFIICAIISYTSFLLGLKNNSSYWTSYRTLGMSKNKMGKIILQEGMMYSVLGIITGFFLGILAAKFICILTKTNFTIKFLSCFTCFFIVLFAFLVSIVPIAIALFKNRKNSILYSFSTTKKQVKSNSFRRIILSFAFGVIIILGIFISSQLLTLDEKKLSNHYSINVILTLLAVILITVPTIYSIMVFSRKLPPKMLKLASYTASMNPTHILGISVSLVICLIVIGTLINFSYSAESWVGDMAEKQLLFDGRATSNNDTIGNEQINSLINLEEVNPQGVYRLGVGKLNNRSIYIVSEKESSKGGLYKIYNSQKSFSTLQENEIAITERLLKDLNLNIGDQVDISLNDDIKKVVIAMSFETQDYSSYFAVVSADLYLQSNYQKLCANISLNDSVSLEDIKSRFTANTIEFSSKSELRIQWQETIISGVDIILYVSLLIAISLLIMLSNVLKNSIIERKQDFAILRTMGVSKYDTLKLLFAEVSLFQVPTIIISIICTPLFSTNFTKLNASLSGYQIEHQINLNANITMWILITMIIYINPIKIFYKIKNESAVESLKCI